MYLALNRYTVRIHGRNFLLFVRLGINLGFRSALEYDRFFCFGFGLGGADVLALLVEANFDHWC